MQSPELSWKDNGTPVSDQFDDPYFSMENGLAETQHVFLAGNNLPERLCADFRVAELGFGTGLNFLALWAAIPTGAAPVHFTSFEAYPMQAVDLARALEPFHPLLPNAAEFIAAYAPERTQYDFGKITLELVIGDARETLPLWPHQADAWFLDGFSPAKNPQMWEADLMAAVGDKTRLGGSFATYTAAGFVRRGLKAAGFDVKKTKGFGWKRDMSVGTKSDVRVTQP